MPGTVYSQALTDVVRELVKARKASGLLQVELAERIGKDQSFISNIERGQRRMDVLELYAIARAMDRDPVDLYRELIANLPDYIEI